MDTLTNLIGSTDWTNISPEQATCYFVMQGVKNNVSKQICVHFLQEGRNNLHELREELKKSETKKTLLSLMPIVGAKGSSLFWSMLPLPWFGTIPKKLHTKFQTN